MNRNRDAHASLRTLANLTRDELFAELWAAHNAIEGYAKQVSGQGGLLDETRDYVDVLKRRADLIHAISDHMGPDGVDAEKLERIAAIVWPAIVADAETEDYEADQRVDKGVDISVPTSVRMNDLNIAALESMLVVASNLLWNAHWFFKAIEDLGKTGGGRLTLGEFLERNITQWRERVNNWRYATGVEKHETDDMKRNPI